MTPDPKREAIDGLDDLLDRLATGRGMASHDTYAPVSAAATRFHALDAADLEPDPDPAFLRRLEEELMHPIDPVSVARRPTLRLAPTAPVTASNGRPSVVPPLGSGRRDRRARWWSAPSIDGLTTVAALLLTLTVAFAAFRVAPLESGRPVATSSVALGATPNAASSVIPAVDVAECAATPRPGGVDRLLGQRPERAVFLPSSAAASAASGSYTAAEIEVLLQGLPDANPLATDGVAAAARQLVACRFSALSRYPATFLTYDLEGAYWSLFSDDYFRRELELGTVYGQAGQQPIPGPVWIPSGAGPVSVEAPKALPDGRVVAVLREGKEEPYYGSTLAVFAETDGRWQIDEWAGATLPASPEDATTAAALGIAGRPRFLEIAVSDQTASLLPIPSIPEAFPVGGDIEVTVANFGTVPHRYRVEGMGGEVEVAPGHSVTSVLPATPPPGGYRLAFDGGRLGCGPSVEVETVRCVDAEGTPTPTS